MHCIHPREDYTHKGVMDFQHFKETVHEIYFELAGDAKIMNDPVVQPEMQKLVKKFREFIPLRSPLPQYPLLLSVSSTRLRQLVQDRYPREYEFHVEQTYGRRWGNFAMDASFAIFNYDPKLLKAEPALACYLNSDDQRCYITETDYTENFKWHPKQLALYVQLSDTALGISLMRQFNSPSYFLSIVRRALRRLVYDVQTDRFTTKKHAPHTAHSFYAVLQKVQVEEMVSLVVVAKEVSTLLTLDNITLRAVSHRQLTTIINPVLVWMVTHKPGYFPGDNESPTIAETTGKPMKEKQIRTLFSWAEPQVSARRQCLQAI